MKEQGVYSITWNFPPTSYSRLYSVGFGINSVCGTWPKCSCCAASNSPMKQCGSGKNASHPCLPNTFVANVKERLDGAGTSMRRTRTRHGALLRMLFVFKEPIGGIS